MKRILTLIIILTAALTVFAQTPPKVAPTAPPQPQAEKVTPKSPYDSARGQLVVEKQKNLQLQAQQAQQQFQQGMKDMQTQYGDFQKQLEAWVSDVRKANGWDETYTWDSGKDEWTHTPKAPAPAAEKK